MIAGYAAHTHVNAETKAVEHLERQGYRVDLPRYWRVVRHVRRRALVRRQIFPRCLFVGLDRRTQRWWPIRSTCSVVELVASGDESVAMNPTVIERLRRQESDGSFDQISPTQRPRVAVRVTEGPFAEVVGSSAWPIVSVSSSWSSFSAPCYIPRCRRGRLRRSESFRRSPNAELLMG